MNLRLRRAVLCCLLLALMPVLPVHAMGSTVYSTYGFILPP